MPFINDFIIEPIGEQTFILKEDLKYSNSLLEITVKKDFDFDGASIPRYLWSIVGSPMTGGYQRSACMHDALYSSNILPKDMCDSLFLEAMISDGVSSLLAYTMYYAVRFGGKTAYEDTDPIKYSKFITIGYINGIKTKA